MPGGLAAGRLPAPAEKVKPVRIRITGVRTVEVRKVPTGHGLVLPWDSRKIPQDTRDYVITQMFTDQGLVGTAMDGDYQLRAGIAREVQQRTEAYFTGKDPFDIEAHNAAFFQKQRAPVRLYFLEVALWDLIGQAAGLPLFRLWGAASDRVKPYAATVHFNKTPEERAEDALKFHELGFRAIKLRLHHEDPEKDLALARTVVRAVNGRMHVMFDANQAGKRPGDPPPVWDYQRTLRMARELEDLGVYWLEEPLNRYAYEELARVRGHLSRMHLAGGEGNAGLADFRKMLSAGAYSYIQPDPMQSGPVSEVRKIAMLGEAFGAMFGPHHGKSGVGMITNLHMQCAASNSGYLEYMYDPGYWNPEGFQAGFASVYPVEKTGYVRAPEKPGLGIDWDRTFFRRHGLHWSG